MLVSKLCCCSSCRTFSWTAEGKERPRGQLRGKPKVSFQVYHVLAKKCNLDDFVQQWHLVIPINIYCFHLLFKRVELELQILYYLRSKLEQSTWVWLKICQGCSWQPACSVWFRYVVLQCPEVSWAKAGRRGMSPAGKGAVPLYVEWGWVTSCPVLLGWEEGA